MESERLRERLEAENVYLHVELDEANGFREFVGRSPALRVAREVRRVAETHAYLAPRRARRRHRTVRPHAPGRGPQRDRSFADLFGGLEDSLVTAHLYQAGGRFVMDVQGLFWKPEYMGVNAGYFWTDNFSGRTLGAEVSFAF